MRTKPTRETLALSVRAFGNGAIEVTSLVVVERVTETIIPGLRGSVRDEVGSDNWMPWPVVIQTWGFTASTIAAAARGRREEMKAGIARWKA